MSLRRRTFLTGMGAGGLALGASSLLGQRRAHAQTVSDVYPTIYIVFGGGWDALMHFDARAPDERGGGKRYANRNVQAADIRQTASGMRYYQPVVGPLQPYMERALVVRNLRGGGHTEGVISQVYGEPFEVRRTIPWGNYLCSELNKYHRAPAANLITYGSVFSADNQDYVNYHNVSPSPEGAMRKVVGIADFARNLSGGTSTVAANLQLRALDHARELDALLYSNKVQPRTNEQFGAANTQGRALLAAPPPSAWPPDMATRTFFNLGDEDIIAADPNTKTKMAFAYYMAKLRLSHLIQLQIGSRYDSHGGDGTGLHDSEQRIAARESLDPVASLLKALDETPSPIDPTKSMLDTTHVVVSSEMIRTADAESNGTGHWPRVTQVIMWGGRFRAGATFGAIDAELNAVRHDWRTNAPDPAAKIPNLRNLAATVMLANRVDPKGLPLDTSKLPDGNLEDYFYPDNNPIEYLVR